MTKLMKIKSLKNYGIPSYILNLWEKHYSPYLLPMQEEAVKKYGVLDYEGSMRLLRRFAPRNDKKERTSHNDKGRTHCAMTEGRSLINQIPTLL